MDYYLTLKYLYQMQMKSCRKKNFPVSSTLKLIIFCDFPQGTQTYCQHENENQTSIEGTDDN